MKKKRGAREDATASQVEEALVDRLSRLDWPKPTAEVKQRCLDDILEKMSEDQKEEPNATRSRFEARGRARGLGDTHSLTRRAAVLGHRQQPRAFERPVRLATVLW